MEEVSVLSENVSMVKNMQAQCLSVTLDNTRTIAAVEKRLENQEKTFKIILDQLSALNITSHCKCGRLRAGIRSLSLLLTFAGQII